jgi:hypothetical protein
MKEATIYSLKVWLTTAIFGMRIAAVIKICLDDYHIFSWSDTFSSAIYDIPIGIIACLPSWILFALLTRRLKKITSTITRLKLILSLLGILLSLLPFAIIFPSQITHVNYLPDMLPELFGYTLITLVGIWFYEQKLDNGRSTITHALK